MAPPDRVPDKSQIQSNYAIERYRRDERGMVMSPNSIAAYQSRQISKQGYPGQLMIPPDRRSESDAHSNSAKAHQNAEAITRYNKKKPKGKIFEGKHAAAIDQIFENDLHNIEKVTVLPQATNGEVANGKAKSSSEYSQSYLKRQMKANQSSISSRSPGEPDSELSKSFDPMKDKHLWTMWRTAVNGRIVDEVRRLERVKSEQGPEASTNLDVTAPGVYGRALVAPPLQRFIRFGDGSRQIADEMSSVGQGQLQTSQFVYYGLPRVYVARK